MYSAQGDYSVDGKMNTSHSLYNEFPGIKKVINRDDCKYNNSPYYPQEYINNIDKKLLCQHFKGTDKFHPVCQIIEKK
jgi:hypothetical protein